MSIRLTDNHQYNMKRKINKKKYAIGGIVQGGANLLSTGINSTVGGSTATTEAEAKSQTASNMLSGAASGASIGMAAGPIGAAVGAVVGAIPGIIGKKGKVTPNGFFEDPSVTYSTGLFRSNKGIKRAYNAAKQRVAGNRIANTQGQDLAQEFDETYDTDVMTLAQGGYSPSLAYVDDGELIQTPDGQVNKVPEKGQPTDSNLVSLPEGSKILSDKVKYPGTKKTFAQVGEEMMTKKKSKNKDRFAKNSAKLNEMNNKIIHDQLFEMQEGLKKNKDFEATHFAKGGTKLGYKNYNGIQNRDTARLPLDASIESIDRLVDTTGRTINPNFIYNTTSKVASKAPAPTLTGVDVDPGSIVNTLRSTSSPAQTTSTPGGFNASGILGNITSAVGSLAPIISNLTTGDAETVNTNYNPYAGTIASTMRRRRFNITPAIEDLNRSRAINNYNAGRVNPNTGTNIAFRLQSALGQNRAIADLRAQESNVNNQYAGEYAETLNNLGQQYVGATNLSSDLNAQNRASVRNIRRAGLSQLSQWAQNRELMRNQRTRDDAMLAAYKPFLQAGYTQADMTNLLKYLRAGGNNG